MASAAWEEEWELCNDDGFVYKTKKRRHDSSAVAAPPPSDPEAEQRHRRDRKKRILLKLRDQYQREIDQWGLLSNTLRDMEDGAQRHQQPQPSSSLSSMEFAPLSLQAPESVFRPLIDDLLLQAEAQEAILQDLSNLCDVAENICKAKEERLKQGFIDLPVWTTPRTLMASLCDD